jgi:hypothetical protein
MLAGLRRGAAAGEAAAAAAGAYAEAQAGVARVAEAEKAFTSRARSPAPGACLGDIRMPLVALSLPARAGRAGTLLRPSRLRVCSAARLALSSAKHSPARGRQQ